MKLSIRVLALITATGLAAGIFSGCSRNNAKSGNGQGIKLQNVTLLLDWYPNTNHTGLYVADSKGYFKDEGLNVSIKYETDGGSADLVAAKKGEFGISYQEQVTTARTAMKPLPVKAIAAIIQHNTSGFAAPAGKKIKTPKDFEGKRYGGFGTPLEGALLKALMKKYGADYNKLTITNIGSMDYMSAVQSAVDFSWIFYGWDGIAAKVKKFPINFIKLQDLDPDLDFYTPVIITREDILKNDPELVKKFLKATARGYKYAVNNPEKAVDSLLAASPETDREIAVASQKYLADQYMSGVQRWGEMKESIWDIFGNWMYKNGMIEKKLDAKEAFTNEYLAK